MYNPLWKSRSFTIFLFLIIINSAVLPAIGAVNTKTISTTGGRKISALTTEKVLILVDETIYGDLLDELSTFVNDIEEAGFVCEMYHKKISYNIWDSPQAVKKFIKAHSSNLAGCIFIGNIPIAEYRVKGYGNMYETFPCDYYYMDLDGHWDVFEDGNWYNGFFYTVFSNHTDGNGDVKPEIWVGRLSPDPWIGDKTELLQEYFKRNHAYRTGKIVRASRALLYIDDDWYNYRDDLKKNLKKVYPSSCITVVKNKETTRAEDYLNRLKNDKYEWVQLHVHSDEWQHQFKYNNGNSYDTLTCHELKEKYTGGVFYDLYACSALDFFGHCLGNMYLFGQTSGLAIIGSSKICGIGDKGKCIYGTLGKGKCIGEAIKYWYSETGVKFPSLYYGKLILGDPTLVPVKDTTPPNIEIAYPKEGGLYLEDREIIKINPNDNYDCIVIKPNDLRVQVTDAQTNVKTVNVIFDGIKHSAEKTSYKNIWGYPIINNNYHIPEIHSYQVEASDTLNNMGYSKERKICSIMGSSPPFLYGKINGPTTGKTNNKNVYYAEVFDLEGDDVYYRFNWGDDSRTDWEGPIKTVAVSSSLDFSDKLLVKIESEHQWTKPGEYTISLEVKDSQGNHGIYNLSLDVTMNKKSMIKSMTDTIHDSPVFSILKKMFIHLVHTLGDQSIFSLIYI